MEVPELRPYLEHVEDLPFVRSVEVSTPRRSDDEADAALKLRTDAGSYRVRVQLFRSHISVAAAKEIVRRHEGKVDGAPKLVLAPHIGRTLGRTLAEAGLSYVDRQGNCHLVLGRKLYVHDEGHSPPRRAALDRGIRAPGYEVLFAYLAEERLLDVTLRHVAQVAGVSRQAVVATRQRLLEEGSVVSTKAGTRWVSRRRTDALARWLHGYETSVRPALMLATYRTPDRSPLEVEARVAPLLDRETPRWRWGGTAAGFRLAPHYRGPTTTVHVDAVPPGFRERIRAVPDPGGNLILLGAFGEVNWKEDTDTVHPLLVYSEMMVSGDDRAREAAAMIMDQRIRPTWEAAK
jgi:hypothetical protein